MEILKEAKNLYTFGFKFDINLFNPIRNSFPKPEGGLWAIEEENVNSNNVFLRLFADGKTGFKFDLLDAKILVIEFYEDMYIDDLFFDHKDYIREESISYTLDFERISKDFDAIIISNYAAEVLSDPLDFEDEIDLDLEEEGMVIEIPCLDFGSVIVFNPEKIRNIRELEDN